MLRVCQQTDPLEQREGGTISNDYHEDVIDKLQLAQDGYWEKGWNQLLEKWGKDEVERWVAIQSKEEGTSRFLQFMEN